MMVFDLALRNVKKYWRKSAAAVLAISSSVVAQTLFVGYIENADRLFLAMFTDRQMFGDLIIEDQRRMTEEGKQDPLRYALPDSWQKIIGEWMSDHQAQVEGYLRFLNFSGMITNGKVQLVAAGRGYDITSSAPFRRSFAWNAKYGWPLEKEPQLGGSLLGVRLGQWVGCVPEKEVHLNVDTKGYPPVLRPMQCEQESLQVSALTESGQINALNFPVRGMADGGVREVDSRLVLTDLVAVQKLLNTSKVSYATLRWKDGENRTQRLAELQGFLRTIDPNLQAIPWKEHEYGRLYGESMDLLNVFRYFVTAVVLVITGMSVFNTSMKSVMERVKEIGTLLSLGFSKSKVGEIFVVESFLLCLVGNIVGAVGALILTTLLNLLKIEYRSGIYSEAAIFHIDVVPMAYVLAFAVTFGVSVLTTHWTAKNYLKKRIIQNLNG